MSAVNLNKVISALASKGNFNSIFRLLEVTSVGDDCLKCRFRVTEKECNDYCTMHGGFTASLVDFVSTVDLVRRGRKPGVSVDLAISYLNAAPMDTWLAVESYVLKHGKTLAFCEVAVLDETTGKIFAKGRHTKYIL